MPAHMFYHIVLKTRKTGINLSEYLKGVKKPYKKKAKPDFCFNGAKGVIFRLSIELLQENQLLIY
jgi:hypothetical protein